MDYGFLENVAQENGLIGVSPYVKLAVGLGALLLVLLSPTWVVPLLIALSLGIAVLLLARIDPHLYAHLLAAPLLFAVLSVAAVVLVTGGGQVFWAWQPVPGFALSLTTDSLARGLLVFSRVLGGMSALFFIALTTPMTDLFVVMQRCRVPMSLLNLTMFVYRSIFILSDQVAQVHAAQRMRLAYSAPREAVTSFGNLCGASFIASWECGEDLIRAMDARCYDGRFAMLEESAPVRARHLAVAAAYLMVVSALLAVTVYRASGGGWA
ncbi:MAG: cobalt ECF transporter T component CbiQ [Methanomicrobiales archaeon]|nr:cobalt ECF transporter T component CbiQ [Methanomicrobiales archaeon]MDD1646292.1 cobalt ECF transporter T component CbiQ [Methanomicrobiales archaeon]